MSVKKERKERKERKTRIPLLIYSLQQFCFFIRVNLQLALHSLARRRVNPRLFSYPLCLFAAVEDLVPTAG
jgi:hypothetical protein